MMSGGNWWRAKDISISHLTHERDAGDRWRDKTLPILPSSSRPPGARRRRDGKGAGEPLAMSEP
jgi:hypothetical protein